MSAVDDVVFAELAERKAEIKRLKAELATCRELREYDSKEIEALRAKQVRIGWALGAETRWPDPTLGMLVSPEFEAIWQCIKRWDIRVPDVYAGYCSATGNHVRAILDALRALEQKP